MNAYIVRAYNKRDTLKAEYLYAETEKKAALEFAEKMKAAGYRINFIRKPV